MSIAIQIDVPYLSLPEYARRTGQTNRSVTAQADRGYLPIVNFTEPGKRGKRFVNMVQLYKKAAEQEC